MIHPCMVLGSCISHRLPGQGDRAHEASGIHGDPCLARTGDRTVDTPRDMGAFLKEGSL